MGYCLGRRHCPASIHQSGLNAPIVEMDHEAILNHNRIPKPSPLAAGLMQLFELGKSP
jgi:hypothetical protein